MKRKLWLLMPLFYLFACKAPQQVQPIEAGTLQNVGYFQLNRTEAIEMINKFQTRETVPSAALYSLDFDAAELDRFKINDLSAVRFFTAKYPEGESNAFNGGYTVILQLKTSAKQFAYFDLRRTADGHFKETPTVCPPPNCKPIETFD